MLQTPRAHHRPAVQPRKPKHVFVIVSRRYYEQFGESSDVEVDAVYANRNDATEAALDHFQEGIIEHELDEEITEFGFVQYGHWVPPAEAEMDPYTCNRVKY